MTRNEKPRIAVFTTGGTILSSYDPSTRKIHPAIDGEELLASIPQLEDHYDIELHEFCNMPGPHLSPDKGLELALEIQKILSRKETEGAVVVQGTDTLEEIAYLADLVHDSPKPVVFTGAMKSQNEFYSDSRGNLLGALRLASCRQARNRGVFVFFNQNIHAPRYVMKISTSNTSAFASPECGPIGTVFNDNVIFYTRPEAEKKYKVKQLDTKVELIKATCGMDNLLIRACLEAGVSGIVVEGLGAGNLPPQVVGSIAEAVQRSIPVILVSRCTTGHVGGIYAYEGGGAQLHDLGVIPGGNLSGPKARIKLMVVLGYSKEVDWIRLCFKV